MAAKKKLVKAPPTVEALTLLVVDPGETIGYVMFIAGNSKEQPSDYEVFEVLEHGSRTEENESHVEWLSGLVEGLSLVIMERTPQLTTNQKQRDLVAALSVAVRLSYPDRLTYISPSVWKNFAEAQRWDVSNLAVDQHHEDALLMARWYMQIYYHIKDDWIATFCAPEEEPLHGDLLED